MNWMAFYNYRGLHSSLGYLSRMQYEQRWYEVLNRPEFCRQFKASYFRSNRSPYERTTLPRRIQD